MLKICVEGWRGINHSFSIVNQNQLLELLKLPINLKIRDIPYFNKNWSLKKNPDGFVVSEKKILDKISYALSDEEFDIIYRISYPFDFSKSYSKKLYVFATVEKKIGSYINGNPKDKNNREYLNIITPSNWCKNGLIACGFDDNQINVIPHGVDIKTFHKISDEEVHKYRSDLKINKEDFILTNVGAMSGNKGIHYLIIAFSILKQKFRNLKLILKDQSNLYNKKAEEYLDMIKTTKYGKYLNIDVINDIIFISKNLDLISLNRLYNLTDCYVSPYRAEGFNLPPLEAAAVGTPIIVTKGGSTDDYFHPSLGLQIDSVQFENNDSRKVEPKMDSLIECIERIILNPNNFGQIKGSQFIQNNYNWKIITNQLYKVFNE